MDRRGREEISFFVFEIYQPECSLKMAG